VNDVLNQRSENIHISIIFSWEKTHSVI